MKSLSRLLVCLSIALVLVATQSHADVLKPYKDRLFAYPKVLKSADGGDYISVDYQELRDINKRDKVPERRVNAQYIDYKAKRATKTDTIKTEAGPVRYFYAGQQKEAKIITVYIHGKGGNGKQGINDFSFGGNFNRIKMLMIRNKGLYLSPDAGDFTQSDLKRVQAVIKRHLDVSPQAKLILACGSGGGALCYKLADQNSIAQRLGGIALLGSYWDFDIIKSAAGRGRVPLYISHGSRDTIFAIDKMEAFYRKLKSSNIPARIVRFESGTHGTPIRMVDWRVAINWMSSH